MTILSKIWELIKLGCSSLWDSLNEEPENNVLGQDLPPDEPSDES